MIIEMTVNGRLRRLEAGPGETLLAVLRERMSLRGAKNGCSEGECGACTVLLDGQPIDSCIYPAAAAAHRTVTTVEGLSPGNSGADEVREAISGNICRCTGYADIIAAVGRACGGLR